MTRTTEPAPDRPASETIAIAVPSPGGTWAAIPGMRPVERRRGADRRRRMAWSLVYGGLFPRRLGGRRAEDQHRPVIDWHGPGLLVSCLLILLLCAADAFLTLLLISGGATEANPVMALFVYDDVRGFTVAKMALTGLAVLGLVAVARFRVFGLLRVATLVHGVLVGYVVLIGYEVWLLARMGII